MSDFGHTPCAVGNERQEQKFKVMKNGLLEARLSEVTRPVFERLTKKYIMASDSRLVLLGGLEAYDDYRTARDTIHREGMIVDGKRHAAHDVMITCYKNFLASLRHLGIEAEVTEDDDSSL
jgi:hypothetical protein